MTSLRFPSHQVRSILSATVGLVKDRPCCVVGGAIRDGIIGREVADLDLALEGDAPGLARELARVLGGHFALLDDVRGTARVIMDSGQIRTIDVSRLHSDILADLGDRDFTIDAMAAPLAGLASGKPVDVLDPYGGSNDIKERSVRLVSEQALIDDPLRLLRAVRLAVELEFEIAPSTAEAVRRHAALVERAASERIRDEIARSMATPRAGRAVRLMDNVGLLDALLPEVTTGRSVVQPKEHFYDVLDHNLATVAALDMMLAVDSPSHSPDEYNRILWDGLSVASELRPYLGEELSEGRPRAVLLKLAGLLHDVAKPQTRSLDDTGRIRFFGHADLGANIAGSIMRRLRFSRRETEFVTTLIDAHLRPGQIGQGGLPTRRAMFRFFRDTADAADGVLLLSLADALAARGPRMTLDGWREMVAYTAYLLSRRYEEQALVRPVRLMTGDDVMRDLGLGPGPEIGRLLAAVEEAQAVGEVSTHEEAKAFVRGLARKDRESPAPPAPNLGSQRGNGALRAASSRRSTTAIVVGR